MYEAALAACVERGMDCTSYIVAFMMGSFFSPDVVGNAIEYVLVQELRTTPFPLRRIYDLVLASAKLAGVEQASLPLWLQDLATSLWRLDEDVLYNATAHRLSPETAFRIPVAMKPAFYVGPDLVLPGVLFGCKTSPSLMAIGREESSVANSEKTSVDHILGLDIPPDKVERWPLNPYNETERLGCVIVDLQLPKPHSNHVIPRCRIVSASMTDGGGTCRVRRDVHVLVDFATLDMLIGQRSTGLVIQAFSDMFFRTLEADPDSRVNQDRRKSLPPGVSSPASLENYWKSWIASVQRAGLADLM